MRTHFLNVDLDLVSRHDLSKLLAACSRSVIVHRDTVDRGVHTLCLALRRQPKDVGHAIRGYLALFESLPPSAKRLWNACSDRCLNVGVQAGPEPNYLELELSRVSIDRARTMHARVVFTIYGARAE